MIPVNLLRPAIATASLAILVATVTATLMSPTGNARAADRADRAVTMERRCPVATADILEGKKSRATKTRSETRRSKKTQKELRGVLNLNTATTEQLDMLPGIGPAKAERIVTYRKRHGAFKRVKDLRRVKGFGYKTMKKLDKWLTVKGSTTLELASK